MGNLGLALQVRASLGVIEQLLLQSKVTDQVKDLVLQLGITFVLHDLSAQDPRHRFTYIEESSLLIFRKHFANCLHDDVLQLQWQVLFNPVLQRNLLIINRHLAVFHFLDLFSHFAETVLRCGDADLIFLHFFYFEFYFAQEVRLGLDLSNDSDTFILQEADASL